LIENISGGRFTEGVIISERQEAMDTAMLCFELPERGDDSEELETNILDAIREDDEGGCLSSIEITTRGTALVVRYFGNF